MREREQWRPMRSTQLGADAGADVASARVVDIEDVEDFLVELGAQLALTHQMSLPMEKHPAHSQVRSCAICCAASRSCPVA